jgi:hypothetical protein
MIWKISKDRFWIIDKLFMARLEMGGEYHSRGGDV